MPPVDKPLPPRPAPKAAPKPASSAPAYQAFHTSEAASQQPAVQRANQQIGSRAVAGAPLQTFHTSEAASQQPAVQKANAALTNRAVPGVDAAVINVFKAQPAAQQRAVVQGAMKNPNDPASKVILQYIRQTQSASSGRLAAIVNPANIAPSAFAAAGGTLDKITANALKDAYNLPGGTIEGAFGLAKQGYQGFNALTSGNLSGAVSHYGSAAHMLIDPYIQAAKDPIGTFTQHPLNTLLLAAGPKALLGRGAGFAMRSGVLGDAAKAAASTARSDLNIGSVAGAPSPFKEARDYSPDVFNKALQVSREKLIRSVGRNPDVSKPSALPGPMAYAMNRGVRAKFHRQVDEMTAVHQAEQRAVRTNVLKTLRRAAPSKAARDVVSFVGQRIIRTPETAAADAAAEINRLRAAQHGLQRRSLELQWNRRQIAALDTALKTPGAFDEAFQAVEHLAPFINSQDAALVAHGFLDPEQALRSKVFPYAQAHMGATYNHVDQQMELPGYKVAGGARYGRTKVLSTQEVLDHMKANGVSDPFFVEHSLGPPGLGQFYKAYRMARGTLGRGVRTGKAFEQGSYNHTYSGLIGQVAERAQAMARASLHDRVVNRYATQIPREVLDRLKIKSPNGDYTPEEARRIARAAVVDDHGNRIPNAVELTPIQRAPVHQLDSVSNLQSPSELKNISQLELKALGDSIQQTARRTDGTRNVTLVPRDIVDRFGQQYARTDMLLKHVGKYTQQFRRTVLPYSTHWMLQIGSEAAIRSVLAGVLHPDYLRAGRLLTKELERSPAGRAANAEMTQSTMYSGGGSGVLDALRGRAGRGVMDVHNPNPGIVSSAAHAFPPSRAIIAAHNRYADTITAAMYGLEHNARIMGLGKLAHREIQSFGFSWRNAVKMQGRSIAGLASRLEADPALVAKFGREIDNTFGKYNKFTPMQRAAIQSIAPFLPWYLNAAKYVLWHLPAHHPVASSLLASLRQTVNQDIKDGKMLPLNVWAMQELGRISPFGIFTPPDTTPSVAGMIQGQHVLDSILPQIQGSLYNLAGVNAFGSGPLKGPGGDVKAQSKQAGAAAAENLLEAFLPLARYVRMAEAGGKPTYGTSTIVSPQVKKGEKQGDVGTTVARIFNPFYSIQNAQGNKGAPAFGAAPAAAGGSSKVVIPGEGHLQGVVIPGEGSLSGVVIP